MNVSAGRSVCRSGGNSALSLTKLWSPHRRPENPTHVELLMPIQLNDFELTWHMDEIGMHGMCAHMEYRHLDDLLRDDHSRQTRLVWFALTAFLSHAAMMSKYLDPIGKGEVKSVRKDMLCQLLGVAAESDVISRDARDNVEHFDERVDGWVGTDNQSILESVLPDRAAYQYLRVAEKRVRRVLLLDEMVFISEKRDQSKFELDLASLHAEVKRIGDAADTWISTKSPYHFIPPR